MFSTSTKFLVSVICLFGFLTTSIGQNNDCRLNCVDHLYVSFDENCEYELDYEDVLKNPDSCDLGILRVEVYDPYGNLIPNSILTFQHRGLKLVYKAIHLDNSCWGYVTPEDKWAPIIDCVDDTLNCWDAEEFLGAMPDSDNCGYNLEFDEVNRRWVDFDCQDTAFVGYVERSVITTDTWGNTSRCDSQRIYIIREYLDSLVCPDSVATIECCDYDEMDDDGNPIYKLWSPDYVWEDEDGYSHPIPKPGGLVEPPYIATPDGPHYIQESTGNGKCNVLGHYKDHIIPTCGWSYKIRREWKIFDWCTARDTTCIQWIKVLDTLPPVVMPPYDFPQDDFDINKEICLDNLGLGEAALFGICPGEPIQAIDVTDYYHNLYYVKTHECVAHVELERPKIAEECGLKAAKGDPDKIDEALSAIKVSYLVRYPDKDHPGKVYTLTGDIEHGETKTIYLPAGWHTVVYFIKDECWNETYACEIIGVKDIIPPTPVCDEITQTTLDPDSCWTRIYARDLDDGSNDNCSQRLHFAVANMDSIEYYRQYWEDKLIECIGEYDYNHYYDAYQYLINRWINCFVFNDYIDVSECGTEMLVLRVYEADGFPVYDPHKFVGSEHQWFCFTLYDDYSCFFKWNWDKFAHYENPTIDLCNYGLVTAATNGNEVNGNGDEHDDHFDFNYFQVVDGYCQCNATPITFPLPNDCIPCESDAMSMFQLAENLAIDPFGDEFYHGPFRNRVCCSFEQPGNTQYPTWLELTEQYPAVSRIDCHRFQFQHLYNDCMIELIKDDKTPPICIPPDDVTYYCDGVPGIGEFYPNGGNDLFCWDGARFAHDICLDSDNWSSSCKWDDSGDDGSDICHYAPDVWCVAAPWNGGTTGYYGGPSATGYSYDDPCGEDLSDWFEGDWSPIYCRFWLMLDRYDQEGEGKPDPTQYFGDIEVLENCWKHEIEISDHGELDECGVGILTRTWTVTDNCGNTTSCYQRVVIKARSDFEVKFPEDMEVDCEGLEDLTPVEDDPDSYPLVTDADCELIGITYSDQVLDVFEEGCYKILRTWKVIDWCVYVPDIHSRYSDVIVDDRCVAHPEKRPCVYRNLKDDGDGFMTYLQVITVVDDVAPTVTCVEDIEICIFDEECDEVEVNEELGSAEDNCTLDLQYRYVVKPDGTEDETAWVFGHGDILQNTLPVGVHTVVLYARDDCGNEGYCELILTIKDCKNPTPYCYNGIATVIMPSSKEVAVWASDLDAGSFDNCTEQDSLYFSFDEAGEEPSVVFTCDDLQGGTSRQIEVEIWVHDEAGNKDFCVTYLLLQDGSDTACADISSALIDESMTANDFMTKGNKKVNNGFNGTFNGLQGAGTGEVFLYQNRPNPYQFNTIVEFELPAADQITLRVLDITGRVIISQTGNYSKGLHQWKLDKDQLGVHAGVLYYQLTNNELTLTKKMVIVE